MGVNNTCLSLKIFVSVQIFKGQRIDAVTFNSLTTAKHNQSSQNYFGFLEIAYICWKEIVTPTGLFPNIESTYLRWFQTEIVKMI